jgi:16S rRNA processing protein RimM
MPALAGSLPLGVLGRAHGVRGEMTFRPYNPGGTDLGELRLPLTVELRDRSPSAGSSPATLVSARPFKDGALVRFEGIDSPERASSFTNRELCVPRAALPPLDDGEFYVADLVGCAVVDLSGRPRGTVAGCFWNGSQDILQIRDAAGEELLLPAVEQFLREVDLAARRIVVDAAEEAES